MDKCCLYIDSIMSGSPIIQDGKLAGAVTHVFV
ncbi:SpoIVB peptidase S55 domain-containing protein [Enterocloster hominis]|uniref:SpoIVB peptidase S55 domain-containing protein n=1 Tax=Enterocloster hominis (ex Hitch et al. 2024) TaxID=1917870 RepID=A0ABV1D6X1_9FIRM